MLRGLKQMVLASEESISIQCVSSTLHTLVNYEACFTTTSVHLTLLGNNQPKLPTMGNPEASLSSRCVQELAKTVPSCS
jgi:hypothetical protein